MLFVLDLKPFFALFFYTPIKQKNTRWKGKSLAVPVQGWISLSTANFNNKWSLFCLDLEDTSGVSFAALNVIQLAGISFKQEIQALPTRLVSVLCGWTFKIKLADDNLHKMTYYDFWIDMEVVR